jgi:hypothetical protein
VRRVDRLLAAARLGFATSGVAAIAYQAGSLKSAGVLRPGNFFSFFTIQSNILAICILVGTAVVRRHERSRGFDAVRGAVTLYMAITGVVFAVLLAGAQEDLDTHIGWVNFVVHTLLPIVLVVDWLVDPPRRRFWLRVVALWLAYPLAWFAYTLIRGTQAHWYPYPFVNVAEHGYGRVFLNGVLLLLFFGVAAAAFGLVGNLQAARQIRQATP